MMRRFQADKKGVSPIIATLLLIVITVAAGVVAYSFVAGYIGTSTQNANQIGVLSYDAYDITSPTTVNIYLRNAFPKEITTQAAYIDSLPATPTVTSGSLTIQAGVVQLVTVNQTGATLTDGAAHQLRIVCTDGSSLQFPIVKST